MKILAANEDAPKFEKTVHEITVREDFKVGNILHTFPATGQSALKYKLIGGHELFKVYPNNVSDCTKGNSENLVARSHVRK